MTQKESIRELKKQIKKLQEENEELRESVAFYRADMEATIEMLEQANTLLAKYKKLKDLPF